MYDLTKCKRHPDCQKQGDVNETCLECENYILFRCCCHEEDCYGCGLDGAR